MMTAALYQAAQLVDGRRFAMAGAGGVHSVHQTKQIARLASSVHALAAAKLGSHVSYSSSSSNSISRPKAGSIDSASQAVMAQGAAASGRRLMPNHPCQPSALFCQVASKCLAACHVIAGNNP